MQLLNGLKWVAKIFLGIFLALTIYNITFKLAPGLFVPTGESAKHNSDLESTQQAIHDLQSKLNESRKKKRALKAEIKQLQPSSDKFTSSQRKLNELAAKIFDRTKSPSLITVTPYNSKVLSQCTGESRKVRDAWLQFLIIYSQFELKSVTYNNAIVKEILFSKAGLLNSISPSQVALLKPLTANLLKYHKKIISVDDWSTKLEQLERVVHSGDDGTILEKFYAAGYPKSDDLCFTSPLLLEASSPPQHYSANTASLEKWFYTFWVRRFSEGNMNATYYALELIELALSDKEDSMDQTFVYATPEVKIIDQDSLNTSPLSIYQNLLVSRFQNNKRSILVGSDKSSGRKNPLHKTIYAFSGTVRGKAIQYLNAEESNSGEEGRPSHAHVFDINDGNVKPLSFYSIKPVKGSLNEYLPAELNDKESEEVKALMTKDFGSAWGIEATYQGKQNCAKTPGTVRSFRSKTNQIFLIEKKCSQWTGEGTAGPYIVAIAERNPSDGIFIKHRFLGLSGGLSVKSDYIADIDSNGNLELFLRISQGVSSSDFLVELDGNGWTQLRELGNYSEGGYEDYPERSINENLLFSK